MSTATITADEPQARVIRDWGGFEEYFPEVAAKIDAAFLKEWGEHIVDDLSKQVGDVDGLSKWVAWQKILEGWRLSKMHEWTYRNLER